MRVAENPGLSIEVQTGSRRVVSAERVSPFMVAMSVILPGQRVPASVELDHAEGLAFLHGLAALYDCDVVEH